MTQVRLVTRRGFVPVSLIVLAAFVFAAGCASNRGTSDFMKSVNSIEPGTAMENVRDKLGSPNQKKEDVAPIRPAPPVGSPEGVLVTLPPKMKYQEWIYHRGDSNFHVFFVPTEAKPGHWEVLAVRSAPASKVY